MTDYGPNIKALEELDRRVERPNTDDSCIVWTGVNGTEIKALPVEIPGGVGRIAVLDCRINDKDAFEKHLHADEIEIIVCYAGRVRVTTEERMVEFGPSGCIRLLMSQAHIVESIGDEPLRLLGITVPASKMYQAGAQPIHTPEATAATRVEAVAVPPSPGSASDTTPVPIGGADDR